jgi:hypothetical protein
MHEGAGMLGKDRQQIQGQKVEVSVVSHPLDDRAGILSSVFLLLKLLVM